MDTPVPGLTIGVDTHREIHAAAAVDEHGRLLATTVVPSTLAGHRQVLSWARELGPVAQFGVEGTGSFGAGLARHLRWEGVLVIEVDRPSRRARRTRGKTDTIDTEIAARAVLSGSVRTRPKAADGDVKSLRLLCVARRSAMKARTQAANQLKCLFITAPDQLREQIRRLSTRRLVAVATRWRVGAAEDPVSAARFAIRSVARRHRDLTAEIEELDRETASLVSRAALELLAMANVGAETAAALLIAAGDNPERLRSEASFAHLCGVAPLPASSGV